MPLYKNMNTQHLFASHLRQARIKAGLTQAQAADLAGLTNDKHISAIENGRKYPSPKVMDKLLEIYKVKINVEFVDISKL